MSKASMSTAVWFHSGEHMASDVEITDAANDGHVRIRCEDVDVYMPREVVEQAARFIGFDDPKTIMAKLVSAYYADAQDDEDPEQARYDLRDEIIARARHEQLRRETDKPDDAPLFDAEAAK